MNTQNLTRRGMLLSLMSLMAGTTQAKSLISSATSTGQASRFPWLSSSLGDEASAPNARFGRSAPPRVALVLGSGGARGLAHVGVLQVLEAAGIPIDLIVGASAGSIVGSLYADSANAAQLVQIFTDINVKNFIDFSFFHILNGPITGKKLENFLKTNLRAGDFSQLQIPFVAVTTDFDKGEVYPIGTGPIVPAVHASAALPPYFRSVKLQGRTLVDGGVTAPLPVNVTLNYHPQVVIAVDVSGTISPKLPRNDVSDVQRSYSITLSALSQLNSQKADVVIKPDVDAVGTFKFSDTSAIFAAGGKAAQAALPSIQNVLKARGIW